MTFRQVLAFFAPVVLVAALGSASSLSEPAPPADAVEMNHGGGGACTLLCIQGYHCVAHGGNQKGVPN